ncbi:YEATS domain-containing protein 2 isoform X2 [Apis mellifera]|uniref:YEATS domain-containing protein 2 isoform X2 n=1 Tax=Apis mellifera TaxID=7460 RepID=A0A7M7GNF2_APIME|nr:YEATS domain-containing protein 2 isoform X2 [Apis mellifera]|eukprot:XP_006560274.1 YEATS domain-containing protein 2 isoform X2 [Apis mellifera]
MSALKDQDPDYGPSAANNEKHQRIYEENARTSTAKKINAIIEKEFSQEINTKEKEVLEIQERLHRATKILHLLRYVIVADFYNRKQCQNSQNGETKQTQIHPAIKELIGKSPKISDKLNIPISTSSENYFNTSQSISISPFNITGNATIKTEETSENCRLEKRSNETDEESRPKKIPRYIPPKSGIPESQCPSRGIRHKIRKRIIIGNISKWIPPEWREDAASHKWTMYVRGNKENPDINDFVSKVRFFLHPSYRPNDVVEVTSTPFCLSRRGWGEFPLRVQLHFKSALNKPMDIIHYLKLDRTYTGLQTLGSETLVDIWIYADSRDSKRSTGKFIDQDINEIKYNCKVKLENDKDINPIFDFTSNNNINETLKLTDKICDVLVKKESSEDIKISEDLINMKKLLFYIELDHDYCGSKYLNSSEKNLTIDHSLIASTDLSLDKTVIVEYQSKENKKESIENNNIIANELSMNGDLSNLKVKEELINTSIPSLNEINQGTLKVFPLSCSKVHSNLRPLEISIPPLFEPSGNKHVLVLQNNKTIPVDITVPCMDDNYNNDLTKSKNINLSASRGISLLKKPLGSETTIQIRNTNGTKVQQGLKLKVSKSILLNVNSNVPVLKIADKKNFNNIFPNFEKDSVTEQMLKIKNEEIKESKALRQKITLGKDKYKIQSKKEFYDDVFRTIETANILNIQGLLRFIIRRMPMITRDASDSDYRRLHPYACVSEEEFFRYTITKRNACEWNRAKMIWCFLKKKPFTEEELWSIKEIMIWARLHGYTPLSPNFNIRSIKQQKSLPNSTITKYVSTCTEPDTFCKWLQINPCQSNDNLADCNSYHSTELDIEIDVVNIDVTLENKKELKKRKENKEYANTKITVLELERKLEPFYDFVCETAREIGIKLISEEIVPTVVHCAASRMIMLLNVLQKI